MAYPNNIPGLNTSSVDVSEFFLGGLRDTDYNLEEWPGGPGNVFYTQYQNWWSSLIPSNTQYFIDNAPSLPMTRGQFYTWVNNFSVGGSVYCLYPFATVGGNKMYTYSDIDSNWTISQVRSWGKIKALEWFLFESVGNGGSTSDTSTLGSGNLKTISAPFRCNLYYYRFALNRIPIGSCHTENESVAAPTNFTWNSFSRSFDFTYAPGDTILSNYKYFSPDTEEWTAFSSKPQLVNYQGVIDVGSIGIIHLSNDPYRENSAVLYNTTEIAGVPFNLGAQVETDGTGLMTITVSAESAVDRDVVIEVDVLLDAWPDVDNPYTLTILYGQTSDYTTAFKPGLITPTVADARTDVLEIQGRPINMIF